MKMSILRKLLPLGLVLASALIVNCGYVATNLYGVSGVLTVIFIPSAIVVCLGWFLRSMKRIISYTFSFILLSAVFAQLSLSAPVLLNIIEDVYYKNLFTYAVFLRVVQYVFGTTFFSLVTALIAGLAFE
jgi:hypothetical protein